MPGGASIDWEGREVSEEEAAKELGFVNVEAFRWWKRHRESSTSDMVAEIANLKERVERLSISCSYTESMTRPIG